MAVPASDSGCFLPPMLERMETKGNDGRSCVCAGNAENTAFLPQLVVIERVRCKHVLLGPLPMLWTPPRGICWGGI